ncbi:MAG: hypothetical protein WC721_15655 [Victivallaceae bacterium]|jgi:hypothetical protein
MQKNSIPSTTLDAIDMLLAQYKINIRELLAHPAAQPQVEDKKVYLTIAQASMLTGIGRFTLGRLVKSGQLTKVKLSPAKSGKVLLLKQQLLDFLDSKIWVHPQQ